MWVREVFAQAVDALREQRNLDFRRAGILGIPAILGEHVALLFRGQSHYAKTLWFRYVTRILKPRIVAGAFPTLKRNSQLRTCAMAVANSRVGVTEPPASARAQPQEPPGRRHKAATHPREPQGPRSPGHRKWPRLAGRQASGPAGEPTARSASSSGGAPAIASSCSSVCIGSSRNGSTKSRRSAITCGTAPQSHAQLLHQRPDVGAL